jgi:hypothetical protein
MVIVYLAIVGELLSLTSSLCLLRMRFRLPLRPLVFPLGVCVFCFFFISIGGYLPSFMPIKTTIYLFPLIIFLLMLLVWSMRDLRKWVLDQRLSLRTVSGRSGG